MTRHIAGKKTMSAIKIFEEMKIFVDAACNEKNHLLAVQAAEKCGFNHLPTSKLSQILADLRYEDLTGEEVHLVIKWRDPSGPFQNLPDINRICLTLKTLSKPMIEYMGEYEY